MKVKRIGGGILVASALIAGWLVFAPPWAGNAGVPAVAVGSQDQRGPGSDAGKKGLAPSLPEQMATAAQPAQPAVVAVAAAPRPVTGGARAYGYGVMDENGQVVPPPRPVGITEIRPGMPESEPTGTERGHDRGPNFNLGLYRQGDGSVYRP